MPIFLTSLFTSMGGSLLKIALIALAIVGLIGGGFVWGDMHATKIAMESSVKDADARVAAVSKSYQDQITSYAAKAKAQADRGNDLASQLAAAQSKLASAGSASKEKISHDVPTAAICDLPASALDVLRGQAARN